MPSLRLSRRSWPFSMLSTAAGPPSRPSKLSKRSPNCPTKEDDMRPIRILMLAGIALTAPAISNAQVAGSTLIGVSVAEMRDVTMGWSAKRQILGQAVYNDKDERVGSIDAIINAGGFIGLTKHDVAIPVSQLKLADNKLVLAGATKEALRASPPFEYAR